MIETEHLTKRYGPLTAVDDVSFRVEPGQVLGFLGPNGAGKSTTMKMITGFLAPSAGTARVCGHDIQREPLSAKRLLGYLPEGAPSYGEMTVAGFLAFVADLRDLRGERRRQALDRVIARLHLGPVLRQPIDTLSKGFKRRVGIAQAILHDPPVLILDEPTDGLDPNQKHEVRTLLGEMAAERTVIISTHILEEVDALCNRVIIIAAGRLLADDTPQALLARSRYHRAVTLSTPQPEPVRQALASLPGVAEVEVDAHDGRLTAIARDGQNIFGAVQQVLQSGNFQVRELQLERGRLDEVFRRITQDATSEVPA
ncbi:MAG TPA: ABC transporter ATP-binding protein [Candidatus Competibacteraceae bacterium]|nr:ABC transporter ATP-binding protein [Candidatus Competibacteraceae bacterium]